LSRTEIQNEILFHLEVVFQC